MIETNNKQHSTLGSLKSLIDELQALLLAISGRLHQLHLHKHSRESTESSVDIWGKLGHFLETHPVDQDPELHLESHQRQSTAVNKHGGGHKTNHNLDTYLDGKPREVGQLGEFYQRERVRVEVKPHMSEQMSRNAMDHINSSLHFAKQGDTQGARLHIELAESATKMASQFMSKSEFKDFETKILQRINDIVENSHAQQKEA